MKEVSSHAVTDRSMISNDRRVILDADGTIPPRRQHLAVRESLSGLGVGVTRLLSDHDAHRLREIYSMDEFDLGPLQDLLGPGADA